MLEVPRSSSHGCPAGQFEGQQHQELCLQLDPLSFTMCPCSCCARRNVKVIRAASEKIDASVLAGSDVILVDPPRAGGAVATRCCNRRSRTANRSSGFDSAACSLQLEQRLQLPAAVYDSS